MSRSVSERPACLFSEFGDVCRDARGTQPLEQPATGAERQENQQIGSAASAGVVPRLPGSDSSVAHAAERTAITGPIATARGKRSTALSQKAGRRQGRCHAGVAGRRYGGAMESPQAVTIDLDEAEAEIRQRWFVWTAAGLSVGPVTWTDGSDARQARRVGRSGVASPASLGLHVSRPTAHVDVVVHLDGWAEVTVLRPEAEAVVQATAQLESVAAFAELLDRAVELITWSGVPGSAGPAASSTPPPERADHWVLGYDGERWSNGS